jgi:hypothetical protein
MKKVDGEGDGRCSLIPHVGRMACVAMRSPCLNYRPPERSEWKKKEKTEKKEKTDKKEIGSRFLNAV